MHELPFGAVAAKDLRNAEGPILLGQITDHCEDVFDCYEDNEIAGIVRCDNLLLEST